MILVMFVVCVFGVLSLQFPVIIFKEITLNILSKYFPFWFIITKNAYY